MFRPPIQVAPVAASPTMPFYEPNTLVEYFSPTFRKWIPAVVLAFSEAEGTYTLDVKQFAAPDRIRLRQSADDSSIEVQLSQPATVASPGPRTAPLLTPAIAGRAPKPGEMGPAPGSAATALPGSAATARPGSGASALPGPASYAPGPPGGVATLPNGAAALQMPMASLAPPPNPSPRATAPAPPPLTGSYPMMVPPLGPPLGPGPAVYAPNSARGLDSPTALSRENAELRNKLAIAEAETRRLQQLLLESRARENLALERLQKEGISMPRASPPTPDPSDMEGTQENFSGFKFTWGGDNLIGKQ